MSDTAFFNRRDLDFLLYDVVGATDLLGYPRYGEHSRETFDAVIDLAEQLARETFLPHYRLGDSREPELVDGQVRLIPELHAAMAAYIEAGFMAATADSARGGMQLPYLIETAYGLPFACANLSFAAYPALAKGVANLLDAHGSEAQKQRYMQPILEGRYFGTMCLSEPQAGSSLADLRTRARPDGAGGYLIEGAKMWISAGDHDMGENIIHMVLARLPDAPAGVRGISLFAVPRYRITENGGRGGDNDVQVAGLNHKMGYRASANCFLTFGERGECRGELVGTPNQGLAHMFHMMNEERIGVGLGSIALGVASYRYSLGYARERLQGRHPDQKDAESAPIAIIEHADVRRMLLQQKCYVEGALALALFTSRLIDERAGESDPDARQRADALLELLTPIVKAWSSDWCLRANELAMQVLGGYGYTREYPVEQHYRDNRLNAIHEGTNGIQALDLLGRKVIQDRGAALRLLSARIEATAAEADAIEALAEHAASLRRYLVLVGETTAAVGRQFMAGQVRLGLANASQYMTLVGHVAIAWTWLSQAVAAQRRLARGVEGAEADFLRGKLHACRFFFRHELPAVEHCARIVAQSEDSAFTMAADWF
ncbi:MAG TPA: acyl-CoA dehydrogenase [Xanthomonadales bacterium]|nr:acyl-CoA dehydrogenase [Xanthomonadales bacterium]